MIKFNISKKWIQWIGGIIITLMAGGIGYITGIYIQSQKSHLVSSVPVKANQASNDWYENLDNIVLKIENSVSEINSKMNTLLKNPLQKLIIILLFSNITISILGFGGIGIVLWLRKKKKDKGIE